MTLQVDRAADEVTLARAEQAVRFYRALADVIENDPDLAPTMLFGTGDVSTNATLYRSYQEGQSAVFIAAARRLLGTAPEVTDCFVEVSGAIEGVPTKFRVSAYGLPKRKVIREVEEYVFDEATS